MQIHISNLHSNIIESDVMRLFSFFGEVESVKLVRDRLNNRSLGHAFVDMPLQEQASQAVINLNGRELKGKKLLVSRVLYDPAPNASWSVSPYA